MIPKEGEKIFIKNINSCFGNKDFTDYVKDDNTLMIVGLQTNFCIDAIVKSAATAKLARHLHRAHQ